MLIRNPLATLFGLLTLFLVALPAAGQEDRWEAQVIAQFSEMDAIAAGENAGRVGSIQHGHLRRGQSDEHRFHLEAGVEYVLVGACDDDCDDLSMGVYGPDGQSIGAGDGDRPFVRLLATPRSSTVQVEVDMYACTAEPCRYGVALYAWGDDGQGRGGSGGSASARWTEVERFSGGLQQRAEALHRLRLDAGSRYRFEGFCDDDCSDLDLFVAAPDGRRVGRDVSVTATPAVTVEADRSGVHELRVRMYRCTVEPCVYHVLVHRER